MKKLALAAVLAASVAPVSIAHAKVCPKFDGAHLGANIGWGIMSIDRKDGTKFVDATRGAVGGFHAGYDKVFGGNWLVGAEAGVDFSGQEYVNESYYIQGKLGYIIDNVSFGPIIGWKNTRFKNKNDNGFINERSKRKNAFAAGAEMSTMVTDNFQVSLQYTHDWYSKGKKRIEGKKPRLDQDVFRLKLSYKM